MDDDLERFDTEVTKVLAGLAARQTQATPPDAPDKWNIQQIVEHLVMTLRGSAAAIQVEIEKGEPTRTKPTLGQKIRQWFLLERGVFPSGRKAPAFISPSSPTALRNGGELAGKMHSALLQFNGVAAEAERVLGTARVATHTTLGPLSIKQWRRFHLVHGRHYLRQIARIRQSRGF